MSRDRIDYSSISTRLEPHDVHCECGGYTDHIKEEAEMSSPRLCSQCSHCLRPIKNGFYHLRKEGEVYSSDLWGCYGCGHFEMHGIPKRCGPWWPIYAIVYGELSPDTQSPDIYDQILEPDIRMAEGFALWMRLYYSDWVHSLPRVIPGPWDELAESMLKETEKF